MALIRTYFQVMADQSMSEKERENKLEDLRSKVDLCSNKLLIKAAESELQACDVSFVYKLFLQNIIFAGKL